MTGTLVDNDILIKGACYRVLDGIAALFGAEDVGVLGQARFVVASRLVRDHRIRDSDGAASHWEWFLDHVEELEPSEDEVTLAAQIEEVAARAGLQFDGGESLLTAVCILRRSTRLITGDKRAIESAEAMLPDVPALGHLEQRVLSLEQLLLLLSEELVQEQLRSKVCAEPSIDRAATACFACSSSGPFHPDGLKSYIADLRERASTILAPVS